MNKKIVKKAFKIQQGLIDTTPIPKHGIILKNPSGDDGKLPLVIKQLSKFAKDRTSKKSKGGKKKTLKKKLRGSGAVLSSVASSTVRDMFRSEITEDPEIVNVINNNNLEPDIRYETVRVLVEEDPENVNAVGIHYKTALMHAIELGYIDIVIYLIEQGADINFFNDEGNVYWYYAVRNIEMIKAFINHGVDMNIKDQYGSSILHMASRVSSIDIVQLLIDNDIEVDTTDVFNCTVLTKKIETMQNDDDDDEIVKLLVNRGADISAIENYSNKTPMIISVEKKFWNIVEILLSSFRLPINKMAIEWLGNTYEEIIEVQPNLVGMTIFEILPQITSRNIKINSNQIQQLKDWVDETEAFIKFNNLNDLSTEDYQSYEERNLNTRKLYELRQFIDRANLFLVSYVNSQKALKLVLESGYGGRKKSTEKKAGKKKSLKTKKRKNKKG